MKKKWSILLTANLLSALVSPLMVHAVTPTTESQEILKNMSQTSQTYASESIEQSDMIKQAIKNIQETYETQTTTSEAISETESDTTADTTNMELLEESTQEKDSDSSNKNEPNFAQKKNSTDNKIAARSANLSSTSRAAVTTGKWNQVSWEFNESTGVLTFTSSGNLGEADTSPWSYNKVTASEIKKIIFTQNVKAPRNSDSLFSGVSENGAPPTNYLANCTSIEGLEKIDVSQVTKMGYMFYRMESIQTLDLSSWNVDKVNDMEAMFEGSFLESPDYVKELNISSFNITASKPSNKQSMFQGSNFNKITVGQHFDLKSGLGYEFFPPGYWYDSSDSSEDKVWLASGSSERNPFLAYLAKGHPGTYTMYPPDNPPKPPEEVLKWGTVPYKFDESTGVLTFTDSGTLDEANQSPWNRPDDKVINATKIKKIVFTKPVNAPENSKDLFSSSGTGKDYLSNVTSIEHFDYLNTSKVTSMDSFFSGLSSIKTLDLSKFDTRNVTTMHGMFYINKSISSLNLNYSSFDTSKVSKMSDMFNGMSSLTTLDISNFKTSAVQDFGGMFKDVSKMTNLDLKNFTTSSATDMSTMFNGMTSLKKLNVSTFNTEKVTSMRSMFNGVSSLTDLNIKNFKTNTVNNMMSMFQDMKSLTSLDVSNFNTGKVTTMKEMFAGVAAVSALDVKNFKTDNVDNMNSMFRNMKGISSLNLSSFNFTKVKDKKEMFLGDPIKEITLPDTFSDKTNESQLSEVPNDDIYNGNWVNINDKSKKLGQTLEFLKNTAGKAGTYVWGNTIDDLLKWGDVPYEFDEISGVLTFYKNGNNELGEFSVSPWNREDSNKIEATKIKEIVFTEPVKTPEKSKFLFSSNSKDASTKLQNVTQIIGLEKLDTSKTIDMNQMFNGMSGIKELDLSHFKTNNVTDMISMFYGMSSLESLNVSSFDTSNVTNMSSMFEGLRQLGTLDISSFDTSNVTYMSQMFNNDSAMTRLTIDNQKFNTAKVKTMDNMFNNMSSLESLDTSKFDTSKVTTMASMFRNVRKVTSLNLSSFNTDKVTNMSNQFSGMTGISSLNLRSFDFSTVSNKTGMFSGDTLKEITLPATFSDPKNTTNLNKVSTEGGYNGQWQNSEGKLFGQTDKFLANYNGEKDAGTYRWGKYLTWGEVPYEFNESTGILTFYKNGDNILGTYGNSPWNRNDSNKIDASKIKEIIFTEPVKTPVDSTLLFSSGGIKLTGLTKISGMEKLDTSDTINMSSMFYGMTKLESLNLSSFDTSSVKAMESMFASNSRLKTLDISNFDTHNVNNMSQMFNNDSELVKLTFDKIKFDTSNVTKMFYMFSNTVKLESLDVSSFKTSKVTNMSNMFRNMKGLNSIDVSTFDTSNVTNISSMFYGMENIKELDVSKFNTPNVTNMASMFEGMDKLSSLNLGSFDFTKVTNKSNMFGNKLKQDPIQQITLPTTFSDLTNETNLNKVPITDGYNGNWVNIDNKNVNLGQTPDFLKNTAGKAGTYIWGRQSALHLVKVPDLYDFGNKNSIKDITQILKPQSIGKQEVEIRDDREQKDVWSLSAQASKLESDKLDDLDQARYLFSITSATDENVPIQGITYSDKKVVLPADNSTHVLYSMTDKNQSPTSYNTWIDDMSLIVSQNSGKPNEHYSGTITWSLDSTPQN